MAIYPRHAPSVCVGDGWPIFCLPQAEVTVHSGDHADIHDPT